MITEDTEELMQRVEIAAAAIDVLTDERDRLRDINAELLEALKECHEAIACTVPEDWRKMNLAIDIDAIRKNAATVIEQAEHNQ